MSAALQAALAADGRPAWLHGLIGDEGGSNVLQEQAGASSEEEEVRVCCQWCQLETITHATSCTPGSSVGSI